MVPLRDLATHEPLPGIQVGDTYRYIYCLRPRLRPRLRPWTRLLLRLLLRILLRLLLPLPDFQVGDIGAKIGYNNQDNGFCRFDRVRIPRTNMAMGHSKLERSGKYTAGGTKGRTALYSSMTYVRAMIINQAPHISDDDQSGTL